VVRVLGLHHVQLAMPPGEEDAAKAFYRDVLGLEEVPKLHLGVEEPFAPARKAHPALLIDDLDGLEARLREAGHEVATDVQLHGFRRSYTSDPFGNRIELLAR
jgi:catechol 2,3-dioxygenase-like lactoylglutathione lyase family enzyme